jgi:hypothetical protein
LRQWGSQAARSSTIKVAALCTSVALVVLGVAWQVVRILTVPIADADTIEMVMAVAYSDRPPETFADIAHPFGLVWLQHLMRFSAGLGVAPSHAWSMIVVTGLLIAVATVFVCSYSLSSSVSVGLVVSLVYIYSPCLHDLAGRAEENILYHALFLGSLVTIRLDFWEHGKIWRKLVPLSLLVVLSLSHVQPFMIVAISAGLYHLLRFVSALLRRQGSVPGLGLQTGVVWTMILVAALPLLALLGFGIVRYVPYQITYYSMFSQQSPYRYGEAFLQFAQQYLLTLGGSITHLTSGDVRADDPARVLLGGALIAALILLGTRRLDPAGVALLIALILVFVYEPSSAERWDTVLLALIVLLVVMLRSGRPWLPAVAVIVLLTFSFASVGMSVQQVRDEIDARSQIEAAVRGEETVFASRQAGRQIVLRLPNGARPRELTALSPGVPSLVYLPDEAERRDVLGAAGRAEQIGQTHFYRVTLSHRLAGRAPPVRRDPEGLAGGPAPHKPGAGRA